MGNQLLWQSSDSQADSLWKKRFHEHVKEDNPCAEAWWKREQPEGWAGKLSTRQIWFSAATKCHYLHVFLHKALERLNL